MSDLVRLDEFTDEFREWIESEGGTRFEETPGLGAAIVVTGGETIHHFTRIDGGWVRVSVSQRGREPSWLFEAATIEHAEKRLALERGEVYRTDKGLPMLFVREWKSMVAPGAAIGTSDYEEDGRLLRQEDTIVDGQPVFRFSRYTTTDRSPAAGATWWADKPLDLIIESFKHPTGEPLFELAGDRYN